MKRIHARISAGNKSKEADMMIDSYLHRMKEFVMDSIASADVKQYSPYNYPLIEEKINDYYAGKSENRQFPDWFISFEIFRQIVENN